MVASVDPVPIRSQSLDHILDGTAASGAGSDASSKARHRTQALMLDAWLHLHGNNLYPCREEKERLANDMNMSYVQVNRWFANRRRKQTKCRKTEASSPTTSSGGEHAMSRCITTSPLSNLHAEEKVPTMDFWSSFSDISYLDPTGMRKHYSPPQAISAMQRSGVIQQNGNSDPDANNNHNIQIKCPGTPPAAYQQVPDLLRPAGISSPLSTPEHNMRHSFDPAKLLPTPPAYAPSPMTFQHSPSTSSSASNPFLIAAALGLQPWMNQAAFAATLLPWLQTYGGGGISQWTPPLSAASISSQLQRDTGSDSMSSASELSELSPRPSSDFTDMAALIDQSELSEKESIAVAVLAGLAMQRT